MNDMIGKEHTMRLVERGIVEIAPLAYMRGRTLANAFVVLMKHKIPPMNK